MEKISREDAIARGLKVYYQKPCRNGHRSGRSVVSNVCVKCADLARKKYREKRKKEQRERYANDPEYRKLLSERAANYYQRNKERLKKQTNEYYHNNREEVNRKRAKVRKENREEINKIARERYANDPEYRRRILESCKRWQQKNKEYIQRYRRERYANDPEYRKKVLKQNGIYVKKRYANDPEYRRRMIEASKRSYRNRVIRKRILHQ